MQLFVFNIFTYIHSKCCLALIRVSYNFRIEIKVGDHCTITIKNVDETFVYGKLTDVYAYFYKRKICILDDDVNTIVQQGFVYGRRPPYIVIFDRKIHLIIKNTRKIDYSRSLCQGKQLLKARGETRYIKYEITDKAGKWQEAGLLTVSAFLVF